MGNYVDEALELRDLCRAFDKVARIPIAGAPAASAFFEELHAVLLFPYGAIASRAIDVFSKLPPVVPPSSCKSQRVRHTFHGLRIASFGGPKYVHMDEGGE